MHNVSRRGYFKWSIALGTVAFLGAAHILMRTSMYRVDYDGDPIIYLWSAEGLATEKSIYSLPNWAPPLFPIMLSFYRLFGVESSDMGRYVNVTSFGLIVLVAGHWLHRFVRFRFTVIGIAVAIMVSYPLVRISSQIYSEPLFILMTMLALINMESFLSNRKVKFGLGLSIIFSALAFLTRWMGATVVLTGALMILKCQRVPPHVKWKRIAFYSVVSSLPAALWVIRNWILFRTAHQRNCEISPVNPWDWPSEIGDRLHLWIFVRSDFGWLDICLWTAVILIGFEATKALTIRWTSPSSPPGIGRSNSLAKYGQYSSQERPILPFATFAIVYLVTLLSVAPYTTCGPPYYLRYLLPVYVPTAMTVVACLERFLFKSYHISGFLIWNNSNGWGIGYNKISGPMAITRWIIMGLMLTVVLTSIIRNIVLYIDILVTYNPDRYQF